jgi:hypothetical protein
MITKRREHQVSRIEEKVKASPMAGDDVTASEIAAFVYCAKAWHLERVVGALPSAAANRVRAAGTTHHLRHGTAVHVGSWLGRNSRRVVLGLLFLAVLLVALALAVR